MSLNPQPKFLSNVRALAEQSLGDAEAEQEFQKVLGLTPEAFKALDEQAQEEYLQQLKMPMIYDQAEKLNAALKNGTSVLARGADGASILFAIGKVEGYEPESENVTVELKQVMKPIVQGDAEASAQRFLHVSKAGVGEQAIFKRSDVVEISPLHMYRVISMKASALVEQIATKGLGSVAPVKPSSPDKAKIDLFAQTEHSVFIRWDWNKNLIHMRGYKEKVIGAVADAAVAAEVNFSDVSCFLGNEAEYPSVSLTGSDLPQVQAAAKEVAHVLLSFEGVEPVAARRQNEVARVSAPDYVFSERMQKALKQAIRVIHPNSQASRLVVEEAIASPLNDARQRWNAVLTAWPFVRSADLDDDERLLKDEFQAIFDAGVPRMNIDREAQAKRQDESHSPII